MKCRLKPRKQNYHLKNTTEAVPWIGEITCYIYFYINHLQKQGQPGAHSEERAKAGDGPGKHVMQRLAQCPGGFYLGKKGIRAGMRAV